MLQINGRVMLKQHDCCFLKGNFYFFIRRRALRPSGSSQINVQLYELGPKVPNLSRWPCELRML